MPGESGKIQLDDGSSSEITELVERLANSTRKPTKTASEVLNQLAFALRVSEQWDRIQTSRPRRQASRTRSAMDPRKAARFATIAFVQYIRSDLKPALANCMQALRLAAGDARGGCADPGRSRNGAVDYWGISTKLCGTLSEVCRCFESYKDRNTEAFADSAKGGFCTASGQYDLAVACHQDALELFRAEGLDVGVGRALSGLGSATRRRIDGGGARVP